MILFFSRYILLSRLKNFLSFERFAKMATKATRCTMKRNGDYLHELPSYCGKHNKFLSPGVGCRGCRLNLPPKEKPNKKQKTKEATYAATPTNTGTFCTKQELAKGGCSSDYSKFLESFECFEGFKFFEGFEDEDSEEVEDFEGSEEVEDFGYLKAFEDWEVFEILATVKAENGVRGDYDDDDDDDDDDDVLLLKIEVQTYL